MGRGASAPLPRDKGNGAFCGLLPLSSCGLRDDQALRSRERRVLDESPTRFAEPATDIFDAVNIAVADMDGELAGHERGLERLSVCRIGPEVGQQQRGTGLRGAPNPPQQ